jgi:hypothetical protein
MFKTAYGNVYAVGLFKKGSEHMERSAVGTGC